MLSSTCLDDLLRRRSDARGNGNTFTLPCKHVPHLCLVSHTSQVAAEPTAQILNACQCLCAPALLSPSPPTIYAGGS